jgi:hypothetical protein
MSSSDGCWPSMFDSTFVLSARIWDTGPENVVRLFLVLSERITTLTASAAEHGNIFIIIYSYLLFSSQEILNPIIQFSPMNENIIRENYLVKIALYGSEL